MDKPDWHDVIPLDRLASWMDARNLGSGPIENASTIAGGTQNFLLRFTRAERGYVLRRPPRHLRGNSSETMRREARVLGALAGTDVPHPGLIAACSGEDVIGAAFYLMEPVAGFNATVALPALHAADPGMRRKMGFALIDGIVALGKVDHVHAGLSDLGKLDGYLERQAPRWKSQLDSYAQFEEWPGLAALPNVDAIVAWLQANLPSSFRPGIIHGDYHLANVLFHPDTAELAAIVDWELCTLGDPLLDLAWVLALWPDPQEIREGATMVKPWDGFPSGEELIAHYAEKSGRSMEALPWFRVLACFKLGAILEGTHARACAGKAPKIYGDQLHANTIRLFTRAGRLTAGR